MVAWDDVKPTGTTLLAADWNDMVTWLKAHTFIYAEETGASKQMVINYRYGANRSSLITFTLPASATVGDRLSVVGIGTGGWLIAQNASQLIHVGATASVAGTGGSIASTNQYDCVDLVCIVTDTTWTATSVIGSLAVVTA